MTISKTHAQAIVDEMKQTIHRDINFMDHNGVILASTDPARIDQIHGGALRLLQGRLPRLEIRDADPQAGTREGVNLPIRMGAETVGAIGITGKPEEVSMLGDVIQRMTELMLTNLQQQEQANLTDQARDLFVEDWLFSDAPDTASLETRGALLGFILSRPYRVAIVQPERLSAQGRDPALLHMIRRRLGSHARNYCAALHNQLILLFCDTPAQQVDDALRSICGDIEAFRGAGIHAGVSASVIPADIRQGYQQALAAVQIAGQSRQMLTHYNELSLDFIIQSIPRKIKSDLYSKIFVGCTPQETEEYIQLLAAFFRNDGSIRRCAEESFIHRNTFQYRMNRLAAQTGYDLKRPRDMLLLFLAAASVE